MFGKKKSTVSEIDKEQLELIKYAQQRVKQKRRLYTHFVIFLIGAIILIIMSEFLNVGETIKFFGTSWSIYAILFWVFLLLYHVFSVYITNRFMGKAWEEAQLSKLVAKQKARINQLETQVNKDYLPTNTNSDIKKNDQI